MILVLIKKNKNTILFLIAIPKKELKIKKIKKMIVIIRWNNSQKINLTWNQMLHWIPVRRKKDPACIQLVKRNIHKILITRVKSAIIHQIIQKIKNHWINLKRNKIKIHFKMHKFQRLHKKENLYQTQILIYFHL